ncbi:DUF222 domain-containing protein [Nocardioides sp. MAH-18]|uniref:DUF222 domain-containing protein n=1 Tax=Nocardioides agri TaxID=2682843 RepID=A0A6L6XMZ2_9ACTN|nr:DUF222 domain-containing protein [Nocardioides sp. CGMCC 1.13656]MVQ48117.1 DUF222 domain-containing protein [Nocardioides sp. MAH-18]
MTAIATPRHRVSVATARVHQELDAVAGASVWSMDASETAATLVALDRAEAKLAELKARVAAHADDLHVGQDVAASSAANWLAHQTKQTRAETDRTVRLGHDLEQHPLTRDALAAGDVCVDQARVIVQAVDRLPAEARSRAEQHLLAEAQHHDAKTLRVLGRRLYEVIDPDAADADEAALLEREEAAAMKACRLTLHDDGHGTTHLRGQIPTFHGAALRKMLAAITAPKHQRATRSAGAEQLRGPDAMGQALCTLIERYPVTQLPKLGGLNATLVVTITEDSLLGRVERAGLLDTGDRISPGAARRLLCEAGVIPVVLGGDSMPIDVGRERRFHPTYHRLAITVRDQGCRAEGCDRKLGLHTHHVDRWADGGTTTVDQGISLCPWHHSRIHDTTYATTKLPSGKVAFHRRT